MDESDDNANPELHKPRYILEFNATRAFKIVLEFPNPEELREYEERIADAGRESKRLYKWSTQFETADLFMDLQSPICRAQFDLDEYL